MRKLRFSLLKIIKQLEVVNVLLTPPINTLISSCVSTFEPVRELIPLFKYLAAVHPRKQYSSFITFILILCFRLMYEDDH